MTITDLRQALEVRPSMTIEASELPPAALGEAEVVFDVQAFSAYYGSFRALKEITFQIREHQITAIIGPSGCGKSTLLRGFNRMNDLVQSAHSDGQILYHGVDLYDERVDPVEVRRHIGMVFQKPNPFPKARWDFRAHV
jgi:phosphate transport system ATP-binding protein